MALKCFVLLIATVLIGVLSNGNNLETSDKTMDEISTITVQKHMVPSLLAPATDLISPVVRRRNRGRVKRENKRKKCKKNGGKCMKQKKIDKGKCKWTVNDSYKCQKNKFCCIKEEPSTENPMTTLVPSAQTSTASGSCGSPWFRIGSQCFLTVNEHYSLDHDPTLNYRKNWADARTFCQDLVAGGDLAQPKDLAALNEVLTLHPWIYWLGGRDLATCSPPHNWRWLNGSSITTGWSTAWKDWAPKEPDMSGSLALCVDDHCPADCVDGDCLTMRTWYKPNILQYDECETEHMFLCERP